MFKSLIIFFFSAVLQWNLSLAVQGGWSQWSVWSGWAKESCSGNQRVKTRSCTNPVPSSKALYCQGESYKLEKGQIDGEFSEWSQWSICDVPCGGSMINRTRKCDSPPPSNNGANCTGPLIETKIGCLAPCPDVRTDGSWTPWSAWSSCPGSCLTNGSAIVRRQRECNMPPPMFGGRTCPGNSTEEIYSCFNSCSINGGFGGWSEFTPCSRSCGSGFMKRSRACNNPEPKGKNAKSCIGNFEERKHCKLATCVGAIDGQWSKWDTWSACTESIYCNKGQRFRERKCNNPAPNNIGDDCRGSSHEVESCPNTNCKVVQPLPAAALPVDKSHYLYKECKATSKYPANGAAGKTIPPEVLDYVKKSADKFRNGFFSIKTEDNGSIKYCFEPYPSLTVGEVEEIVPSYQGAKDIKNYEKPSDRTQSILGFSVSVNSNKKISKTFFGIENAPDYYAGNNILLNNVTFGYFTDNYRSGIIANGMFLFLGKVKFNCVVFYDSTTGESALQGSTRHMKISSLFRYMQNSENAETSLKGVVGILKLLSVWERDFDPVTFGIDLRHQFKSLFRLTATTEIAGAPLHLEVIYGDSCYDQQIAFGFTFERQQIGPFMEKIVGKNILTAFFSVINLEIQIGVAWYPSELGKLRVTKTSGFQKEPLKTLLAAGVKPGLLVSAEVTVPKSCGENIICVALKRVIGDDVKFLVSVHKLGDTYMMTAGFHDIPIVNKFKFNRIELFAQVNKTSNAKSVGFRAELRVPINEGEIIVDGIRKENYLNFGGIISMDYGNKENPSQVEYTGKLYMRGMWYHPFGLNWVSIGNIIFGVRFGTGATGFEFGGQIELGEECLYEADFSEKGRCLRIQAYFGYPQPKYFYAKISSLTIGKILRLFGARINLPSFIDEAGYPDGLTVEYNSGPGDVDLRVANGPLIVPGFHWKGTLSMFGVRIRAKVRQTKSETYITGSSSPINLGGVVIMSKNKTHRSIGPELFFHYKAPPVSLDSDFLQIPYFKMHFDGYLEVLGIYAYAKLAVTAEMSELIIEGKIWNLLKATLYISSSHNWLQITEAHYHIRARIDLGFISAGIKKAQKAVEDALNYGRARLKDASNMLQEKKRECKEKMKIDCEKCKSLKCREAQDGCNSFFDKARDTIKKVFRGWRRRRRRDIEEDERTIYDLCRRNKRGFLSKIICDGIVGGGCRAVEHLCSGTCSLINHIGQGLCHVLDIAIVALEVTERAVGWVNTAIKFVSNILASIFDVHSISFELKLGQNIGTRVAANIDLTLFGRRANYGFSLDLKDPVKSVMEMKDKSLEEYKKTVQEPKKAAEVPFDKPSPVADFEFSGKFNIEALSTAEESRSGACFSVLSNKNGEPIRLVGCNSTDERQNWAYSIEGQLVNLYSRKCIVFPDKLNQEIYQERCSLKWDLEEHECDPTRKTVKLRRNNLCASVSKTSPYGPGALTHLGSLKCVNVYQKRLVFKSMCSQNPSIIFELLNGYLVNKLNGRCVRAANNDASAGSELELVEKEIGCHKFSFTKLGSIQHIDSRFCIQALHMEMKPKENSKLILGHHCEHTHRNTKDKEFVDPQLAFAFIPEENTVKMKVCRDSYVSRGEQQFSTMNEGLRPICSKLIKDIAMHKQTFQSSVDKNGFASRAVDGMFNFNWEQGTCMSTKKENNPWWTVDLGKEAIVTDVIIINRGQQGHRLKNIQAHVGNSKSITKNPTCDDRILSATNGEVIKLECRPPVPGRYVSIQMYGIGVLSMCEVIVASRLVGFVDQCLIENGGCQQLCSSNCGRHVECGCLPGFKLAYDKRRCIDIDECLVNNGGCNKDKNTFCKNYPGGFQCHCKDGYILKDNSLVECIDINECGLKSGGCEQMCNNTDGGYLCTCRKGFERKPNNPFGCQDIKECLKNNGGCAHLCHDYDGGYYCSCKPGFTLMKDGKTCKELFCPVLDSPHFGEIEPEKCVKRFENIHTGTKCTLKCFKGYEISSNKTMSVLNCQVNGIWSSNDIHTCSPIKCPALKRPTNGGIVPARCHSISENQFNEYGQRCVAYCKHGYRLKGPATKYCQADKFWSNGGQPVACVKVVDPPYMICPGNIKITLPSHQNWVTFGKHWPLPETNINITRITTSPSTVGRDYRFKYGQTRITYYANTLKKRTIACSFNVIVLDKTPPLIKDCPSNIHKTSNFLYGIITWKVPTFTDNVGIRSVIPAIRKPGEKWYNGEKMRLMYLASDLAGNANKCIFEVSFKSNVCPPLQRKGETIVKKYQANREYGISCKIGYTLFGSYGLDGSVAVCTDGDYYIDDENIGTVIPPCVAYKEATKDTKCKNGTMKFSYDDWFTGEIYYCASCPSGMFYNLTSKECQLCKKGSYQERHGQLFCEPCGNGKSTSSVGSISSSQCLALCMPGYFSENGLNMSSQPCRPCAKGSYSDLTGSTECFLCPNNSTTSSEGSGELSKCYNCGGNILSIGETIKSPFYPQNYPNNITCVWHVHIPGKWLTLKFESFDTFDDKDTVEIWNSLNGFSKSNELAHMFGQTSIDVRSFEAMLVKFRTSTKDNATGFTAIVLEAESKRNAL